MGWSIRKRKFPNSSQTAAQWLLADLCCFYNESVQGGEQESLENVQFDEKAVGKASATDKAAAVREIMPFPLGQ